MPEQQQLRDARGDGVRGWCWVLALREPRARPRVPRLGCGSSAEGQHPWHISPPRLSALPRHRPAAGAPLHPCVRCWKEPGPDAAGDPREDLAVEERLPSLLSSWTRTAGAGGQRGADLAAMQRGSGGMRHGAVSGWLGGSAGTVSTPAATPSLSLCHPHHPCPCPWVSGLFGTVGFSAWD